MPRDDHAGLGTAEPTEGVLLIADERARQIRTEGWTAEHDDEHTHGELAQAAVAYAGASTHWPWSPEAWKPTGDRVRDLVKAGALIAAELDRLLRLKAGRI